VIATIDTGSETDPIPAIPGLAGETGP
jgi:hypothetical protein